MPILDGIEQVTIKNEEGQEVPSWVMLKNVQFKHINFCMNDIHDEVNDALI